MLLKIIKNLFETYKYHKSYNLILFLSSHLATGLEVKACTFLMSLSENLRKANRIHTKFSKK